MSKWVLCLLCVIFCMRATSDEVHLFPIAIDLKDQHALQRGAKLFMNYCSGCHSLRYMRYNRMAKDLGLTTFTGEIDTDLLVNNLIFTSAKIHDPIQISMPATDARQWFGRLPPDLTLSARERGPRWLYTYLKSFYADKSRPFGANNVLVPDVAMPNILFPLAGYVVSRPEGLILLERGEMTPQQFDSALQDLVTFLVYVAEPITLTRHRIGIFVMIFLALCLVLAYQLKKLVWQDLD